MIDTYWQWMAALVLALSIVFIPAIGWRLYLRTLPKPTLYTPDVATEAAGEPSPWQPALHDQVDMILDAVEQEEYERLYGRLRMHADVAMQRGEREQLL